MSSPRDDVPMGQSGDETPLTDLSPSAGNSGGLTDEVLDRLEALLAEATPRPWTHREEHGRDYTDEGWSYIAVESGGQEVAATAYPGDREQGEAQEDAHLITAAVNALPALIAAARAVRDAEEARTPDTPALNREIEFTRAELEGTRRALGDAEEARRVAEDRAEVWHQQATRARDDAEALGYESDRWRVRAECAEATLAEVRAALDAQTAMQPANREHWTRDAHGAQSVIDDLRAALDAGRADQGGHAA